MDDETLPVLYILMRTDLASMNSGKACAQASHAASAFALAMTDSHADPLYKKWFQETNQGFGTVLVLGVTEAQMQTAVVIGSKLGFVADVIHDPTYPIVDGEMVHYIPLDTCAYIFGDKNDLMLGAIIGCFQLHP